MKIFVFIALFMLSRLIILYWIRAKSSKKPGENKRATTPPKKPTPEPNKIIRVKKGKRRYTLEFKNGERINHGRHNNIKWK